MFQLIKNIFLALLLFILFLLSSSTVNAQESYTDILSGYLRSGEMSEAGRELEQNLIARADPFEDKSLWDSLWDVDISTDQRAANALSLINKLYPKGDPSRWDDVSGFWNPWQVPKSLAAVDGLFVAVISLLDLPEESAHWLARVIMGAFISSSRAKLYFISQCPAEYQEIRQKFAEMSLRPPFGRWPEGSVIGSLPLARPVLGLISENAAGARGYYPLDAYGVPSSSGFFAWDRDGGKLYRITLSEENGGFLSPRWQWRKDIQ